MTIDTKYAIGDIVHLFGFPDWPCVITAVAKYAEGHIQYQLEWNNDGKAECEWFGEHRIKLLETINSKNGVAK